MGANTKLCIILLMFLLVIPFVYSLDCQYPEPIYSSEEKIVFYDDGVKLNYSAIEIKDFKQGVHNQYWSNRNVDAQFKVYNNYPYRNIKVEVTFTTNGKQDSETVDIDPLGYEQVSRTDYDSIDESTIRFEILDDDELVFKREKVQVDTYCKIDDGDPCSKSSECGGGFCVEGHCSTSEICFENDCKCPENKIQCDDNKTCVEKGVVNLDVKPECGKDQECKSGYIDETTEKCAKSPEVIDAERKAEEKEKLAQQEREKKFMIYAIISLVFIVLLGIGVIWYLRIKKTNADIKAEEAKQKTLQTEMKLIITRLNTKNKELEKIKEEIEEIKFHKQVKEDELNRLNKLKETEDSLLKEIQGIEQEIDVKWENLKPFPDSQAKNRLVIINPYLGGYKCFYNKGLDLKEYPISSLVHRWVWKKYNGRDPRYGYHIHHIDEDKYNNDPRNLEEKEGKEHYEDHRKGLYSINLLILKYDTRNNL